MNKHCYRLIFSRTHKELRVVSELARSCACEPGQSRGIGRARLWVTIRRAVWLLGLTLFATPAASLGIHAREQGMENRRPEVIVTQNGIPQVNIAAPNQAGISHNEYRQFDVDHRGAILNNSATIIKTDLGGQIQGNPNLNPHGAQARVILNEVYSNDPSQLRGFIEVAGGRAEVIIANPSGILCDGCGTINAGRMTLTTGKPQLNADGSLAGYQVERGVIRIHGGGLNGDVRNDTQYVDILARAVEVNARVWAKEEISVTAGRNHISISGKDKRITALPADGGVSEIAIDMGHMGGMYSGRIHMHSTEAGVGVRNQGGHLQASKSISLSSKGKLSWKPGNGESFIEAGGDITLAAKESIDHHGKLFSGGHLTVASLEGEVRQSGTLAARGNVRIDADRVIQSNGHLLAGSNNNSELTYQADLTLKSRGEVKATGSLLSLKNVSLNGSSIDISQANLRANHAEIIALSGDIDLRQGKIDGQRLTLATPRSILAQKATVSTGPWHVTADNLYNQGGNWQQGSTGESRFTLVGALDNTDGTIKSQQLALSTASLDNQRGKLTTLDQVERHWQVSGMLDNSCGELGSHGNMTLDVGNFNNYSGTLRTQSALNIISLADINNTQGQILAGRQLALIATGDINNRAGEINAKLVGIKASSLINDKGYVSGGEKLTLKAQSIDNTTGTVSAGKSLEAHVEGDWNNQSGVAQGGQWLKLAVRRFNNSDGFLLSGNHLTLDASTAINNLAGEISGTKLQLTAPTVSNAQGKVIAKNTLNLKVNEALENRDGALLGNERLKASAQRIVNSKGGVIAGNDLLLEVVEKIDNHSGEINAQTLRLVTPDLNNEQGTVRGLRTINLDGLTSLNNHLGTLNSDDALDFNVDGPWDNRGGMAKGGKRMTVAARQLDNRERGQLLSGNELALTVAEEINNHTGEINAQTLRIQGASLNNAQGTLRGFKTVYLAGLKSLNNDRGTLNADDTLEINIDGPWDNHGGCAKGGNRLIATVQRLDNGKKGSLLSDNELVLTATEEINNSAGEIDSEAGGEKLLLSAPHITNVTGKMRGFKTLNLDASHSLNNSNGHMQAGQILAINTAGECKNLGGTVQGGEQVKVTAHNLDNTKGTLLSEGRLKLSGNGKVINQDGSVKATKALEWCGGSEGLFDNSAGKILSDGPMSLTGSQLTNLSKGLIRCGDALKLNLASLWDNQGGKLIGTKQAEIRALNLLNDQGKIEGLDRLDMQFSLGLNNNNGQIFSQLAQTLDAKDISNAQGRIESLGGWSAVSKQFNNHEGKVQSQQDITLRSDFFTNHKGQLLSSAKLALRVAQNIDNQLGKIIAIGHLTVDGAEPGSVCGSLNNAEGQLTSDEQIGLKLTTLNNRKGLIESSEALRPNAQPPYNRDGTKKSHCDIALHVDNVLDNSQGKIVNDGAQWITANRVINQDGSFNSQSTLNVSAQQLDNAKGKTRSQQAGNYQVNTLDNQKGEIHCADTLTLTGREMINQQGQIVSNGGLVMKADWLNNSQNGVITSKESIRLETHNLNNRDGGKLLATTQGNISANRLDNNHGSLESVGNLKLFRLEELDNQRGTILAGNTLDINTDDAPLALFNQDGKIESGEALTLNSRTLDNLGGRLVGKKALTLSVQPDYTHRPGDTLDSNGIVEFSVAGTFTNLADWRLGGGLYLSSAQVTNSGSMLGKSLQVNTGKLFNPGQLEADSVRLSVDELDNPAVIKGDDINLHGRIIDNHGGKAVIAAAKHLELSAGERLTNQEGAYIYSQGSLLLRGGDLIENRASLIEADGDITVDTPRLDNLRTGLVINYEVEKSDYRDHRYNYYWRSFGESINTDKETMAPSTKRLTMHDDSEAKNNRYGTLMKINAPNNRAKVRLNNSEGQMMDLWVNYLGLVPNGDGSYDMTFYETLGRQKKWRPKPLSKVLIHTPVLSPYYNTVWREVSLASVEKWHPLIHADIYNAPDITDYNNFRERTVTGTLTKDKLESEGIEANIVSGSNIALRITRKLFNDAGIIRANGNLDISGGGEVVNQGYSVNERREEFIKDHYDRKTKHWKPSRYRDVSTAISTIDGKIIGNGKVTLTGTRIDNRTYKQAQISVAEAAYNAAEAEREKWRTNPLAMHDAGWLSANRRLDSTGLRPPSTQDLPAQFKGSLSTPVTADQWAPISPNEWSSRAASRTTPMKLDYAGDLALTKNQHLARVATSIPNNALFRQQPDRGERYLIVTDPRFTSRNAFICSDYLLKRIGHDPANVHKRLSDGFFEQRLVLEQLFRLTGRPATRGKDAMYQFQRLMNNGIRAAHDIHLVAGIALTPSQIAALQQDIVWMVSETVDTLAGPQQVWLPKVYLASSTLRLTGDGALIGGGELRLSARSLNNLGNLFADGALSIDADQFQHHGGEIQADQIQVRAVKIAMSTNLQDSLRRAKMSAGDISLDAQNISISGAEIDAQRHLNIKASHDLDIISAQSRHSADLEVIAGSLGDRTGNPIKDPLGRMAHLSGEWQRALGSTLNAGGNLNLRAGGNMRLQGSQASAGGKASLQAGGDIQLLAETATTSTHLEADNLFNKRSLFASRFSKDSTVNNSRQEERLLLTTLSGSQGVTLLAGENLVAEGAQIDSEAAGMRLQGKELIVKEARQRVADHDKQWITGGNSKSQREMIIARDEAVGSSLNAQSNITAIADDITVTGSTLHSDQGSIALQAKGDIQLNSAAETNSFFLEEHSSSKGTLSSSSTHTMQRDSMTTAKGSLISGTSISVDAGNDLNVEGSSIAADWDVFIRAGNNVDISAATETESHYFLEEKKKSGLMSGGGIGVTVGNYSSRHEKDAKGVTQSQSFSILGSSQGSVDITAGNSLHIGGADVIAGKDLSLTGDSVQIDPGYDNLVREESFETIQSGLTLALSGAVGSALNSAVSSAQEARKESDGRVKILHTAKAVLSGVQAAQAQQQVNPTGGDAGGGFAISLSVGSQQSSSKQRQEQTIATGSTLNAGGNLSITAMGKKSGGNSGDIMIAGSQLMAAGDTALDAQRDLLLSGSTDKNKLEGSNKSSGGNVGVSVGVGQNTGFSVFANANSSTGKQKGQGATWNMTTLNSGQNIILKSGRDTTLQSTKVNGEQITAKVGRNLTMQSQQDSEHYESKQTSVSGGVSVPIGAGTGSASVSMSQNKVSSDYNSVNQQTGLFAGKGGYNLYVQEHTQLDGAVIASVADPSKNLLDTGTLGWLDIHNKADYSVQQSGASVGSGGPVGPNLLSNMSGGLLSNSTKSDHAEGITRAAVSEGSIIIRDNARQQQDIAQLSHDTDNANDRIERIFDKEKEQNRLKAVQLISELGGQAIDIMRTEGDIQGLRSAKAANPEEQDITALRATPTYRDAMQRYGTGSDLQKAAQAVTGALSALATGNLAGAAMNGAMPYLATEIKNRVGEESVTANAIAHAVLGAVAAELNNQSALAGAVGGGGGELAARAIAQQMFPDKDRSQLSESEKQQVSTLSQLAAGFAGALTTSDTAGAITAAQTGKNAVENNFLSPESIPKGLADHGQSVSSYAKYAQENNLTPEQVQADLTRMIKGDLPEGADIVKAILSNAPVSDTVMAVLTAKEAKDYALALLSTLPAERALAAVGKAANVITNKHIVRAAEKISTAKPGLQFTQPRDLNEQVLWNQVKESPANGKKFSEMGFNLNTDPRFPQSSGFEKMTASHKLPNGSNIEIHYQHNSNTNKAYDMKIVTPQRNTPNPSDVIDSIKDNIR